MKNVCLDWDRPLQLWVLNEELLISACHQHALNTSLPFVHTARRSYRLNGEVKPLDSLDQAAKQGLVGKLGESYFLEEGEVVTRYP
ncbi:hypothetical protein GEMRC1_000884 [Eukaryota sp. GEM-RC1]